ncbi:hypothetical protein [Cohnella lupini]|uniref:Uncharacterized protein n=1 Tax=Cohnella lupini TaxID=1294267 RepID=A0A3D9HZE7_9BACL|nr:hypothetical protein [Cohnella lupini]RED54815.1 hypothetical protein DFP95_12171 [Cohnella lupini]
MDVKLINEAFLHGWIIKIKQYDKLVSTGKIVEHTRDTIRLDDGMHYYKSKFDIQLAATPN